jgi:hypothetical protein
MIRSNLADVHNGDSPMGAAIMLHDGILVAGWVMCDGWRSATLQARHKDEIIRVYKRSTYADHVPFFAESNSTGNSIFWQLDPENKCFSSKITYFQ